MRNSKSRDAIDLEIEQIKISSIQRSWHKFLISCLVNVVTMMNSPLIANHQYQYLERNPFLKLHKNERRGGGWESRILQVCQIFLFNVHTRKKGKSEGQKMVHSW